MSRLSWIAALAWSAMAASTAAAQPAVSQVTLLAVMDAGGWRIDAEVEGTGVTSAAFTPPGRSALELPCENDPDVVLCEREEPALPAAGFASLASLLAEFPAGSWQLSVNGGQQTATLPFDPQSPDGFATVTDPADAATHVSATPDVSYQNACTICGFLEVRIEDAATLGESLEIDALVFGPPPLPSGRIAFADFFDGSPTPLLLGDYKLFTGVGNGVLEARAFDQGAVFQYGTGAEFQSRTSFSVPEPAGSALVACGAILGLSAGRARRVPRPR